MGVGVPVVHKCRATGLRLSVRRLQYGQDRPVSQSGSSDEGERGDWKSWLKTQHSKKTKIMASGPITSWQIEGEKVEAMTDIIFLSSKVTANGDCSHEIKTLAPWKEI